MITIIVGAVLLAALIWRTRAGQETKRTTGQTFHLLEKVAQSQDDEHARQKQLDNLRGPDFLKQVQRARRIPTEWAPARHAVDEAPKRVEPMQVTRIRTRTRRVS